MTVPQKSRTSTGTIVGTVIGAIGGAIVVIVFVDM
jgi:hypothetical protein